ncbi:MAG: hypothetical protein HC883_04000 [Bdellovibrionaceae bacterium]|nr:hypothetical protein [Pseudobdellovibrionaceae bacterium]
MGIRLVIVDDAPFIREVLRHIFNNTEIEVVAEHMTEKRLSKSSGVKIRTWC